MISIAITVTSPPMICKIALQSPQEDIKTNGSDFQPSYLEYFAAILGEPSNDPAKMWRFDMG